MTKPRETLVSFLFLFSAYCFLFYNMVSEPLFDPCQDLCCCVFCCVSWLCSVDGSLLFLVILCWLPCVDSHCRCCLGCILPFLVVFQLLPLCFLESWQFLVLLLLLVGGCFWKLLLLVVLKVPVWTIVFYIPIS
jgi:hypothetical protein